MHSDHAGARGVNEWSSRAHRKHASRLSIRRSRHDRMLWAPRRASWWISVFFVAGSACFLFAPMPWFLQWVGPQTDGTVFFVGSILFTSAAAVQWLEAVNAPPHGSTGDDRSLRVLTWEPHRIDWWVCGVQLLGTLFFNVTTFRSLLHAVDSPSYDRLVWRPDAIGSICFLVSGYLAYVEVTGGLTRKPPRRLEGGIVTVNLLGCLFFGVSAFASYVVPSTGSQVNIDVANVTTAAGALCFLIGALLLLPEGVRAPLATPDAVPPKRDHG